MALKGTLKDFGIADILQLIGQQQKTGVLYIKSKYEEVEVSFLEGQVVRALSKTRQSRERLGAMLVSCGLLTQTQLNEALEIQKRTLKRLGDILVAEGKVTAEQLREMTALQTSETVYKLFTWNNGTYEFVQQDVEHDPAQGLPSRPESILMEGFRRIDEWPMIRRRVTSMGITFERIKALEPPPISSTSAEEDVDAALDAALDSGGAREVESSAPKSISRNERLVYKLAEPGVAAERLCEVSRIGEFETCKALYNLLESGYLKSIAPRKGARDEKAPGLSTTAHGWISPEVAHALRGRLAQFCIATVIVLLFAVAARAMGTKPQTDTETVPADASGTVRTFSDTQQARLIGAIELYRLLHGEYPTHLNELVNDELLDREDLRYPFESNYHYRAQGGTYVLLPPLK